MTEEIKKPSEESLQKALISLTTAATTLAPAILSYIVRQQPQRVEGNDDISEGEFAEIQLVLLQEAAKDVELLFDDESKKNITAFSEKLKSRIIKKMDVNEEDLKKYVCDELQYCKRVGSNWRGKLLFGTGLALAALLVDWTGLSFASILFLFSTGYFDELCDCRKSENSTV